MTLLSLFDKEHFFKYLVCGWFRHSIGIYIYEVTCEGCLFLIILVSSKENVFRVNGAAVLWVSALLPNFLSFNDIKTSKEDILFDPQAQKGSFQSNFH